MTSTVRSAAVRLTMENASYIRGANQAAGVTEQATGRMKRAVAGAAVSTRRDWDVMGKYGRNVAVGAAAGLGLMVKTTADFASEMALVRTLSHAGSGDMDRLSRAALTMGRNIGYSAKEVAQGEEEMIKAGISVKDILGGGLKGALELAAAGQTDVATATTIAASAMTQFKLQGKDIPHLADLLSAGADKALGSVEDLGLGLEQAGTTANQMGLSVEQTIGTLAAFAQAGLIGERGGTTFKQMLLQLAAPTKQAKQLMDQYGISLYNSNGQIKTMPQLADNLQKSLSGLTPAQRNAALGVIFGSRAIQGANILMADGRTEIAKWIRKVNDQGFAAHQASGKLDSLSGDVKKFKSTLDTTFIQAGSPSQKALRDIVQGADHMVQAFSKLPDEVQQGTVKMIALAGAVGGVMYAISKGRNVARDFGYFGGRSGRAGVGGGLGRAASLAAPVPVFVTNLGAGGLGGAGGPTILGGGGAGASGKVKGFRLPRGTGLVMTATGLVLMATGVTDKTHTGSTVTGGLAGGQIFGAPGALIGTSLGALDDVYNAGNPAKNALDRAKRALQTGDIKEQRAALADLQKITAKLATGGWGQAFARGVTELTGRRKEIEETGKALQEALDPQLRHQRKDDLLYLLSGGTRGSLHRPKIPKPEKDPLETLLNPSRKGVKKPKELTSEEVLANFYGINPKKLKPVPLMDRILDMGDIWPNGMPGGKGRGKNPVVQFAATLGLDTSGFDKKAGGARRTAAKLDSMRISPKVTANTHDAMSALGAFGSYLASLTRPRTVDVGVKIHKGAVGAGGSGGLAGLLNPGTADGGTITGPRYPYGDKVLTPTAPGEEVISNRHGQADKWRPFLKRINAGLADGGTVGPGMTPYAAGTNLTIYFPTPTMLAAAVAAADRIAADAAKVEWTAKDARQQNLDDLHTQQQIRDITRELHKRNKKHKLELRGLDRTTALAELDDAKKNLVEIRHQKQAALDEERKAQREALQQARKDATDTLTGTGDVFARGTSPASAISSVDRAVADISSYGQVMAQLKGAGASPALLQQLINRAQTGDFRSAIRLGRALLAQPVTLRQLNASLSALGTVSSSVATMTTDPRFLGAGAWNPTATKVVEVNLAADPSSWLMEVQRVVRTEVQNMMAGALR